MNNVHALNTLPSQGAINSIATYRLEFEKESLDYEKLLTKLNNAMNELKFMCDHDNSNWLHHIGSDYLSNPTLFAQAPLTYLCAFLSEIFKKYELPELQEKLSPVILKSILIRFGEFKID